MFYSPQYIIAASKVAHEEPRNLGSKRYWRLYAMSDER